MSLQTAHISGSMSSANKIRRGYSSGTGSVSPSVIRPYDMRSYVKVMVPRPVKTLYVPYNSCQCLGMRGIWPPEVNKIEIFLWFFIIIMNPLGQSL